MNISIGVFAYNEEDKIGKTLDSILNQTIKKEFKEILVFSDGSTDNTNKIIKDYEKRHPLIKTIIKKKRQGKVESINNFLERAKGDFIVISSGDIILKKDCIEEVSKPLKEPEIGIVGVRVIPITKKGIMGKVSWLEWDLLDKISREKPKFGELVGFKPLVKKIEKGSVDEEQIYERIREKGYKGVYNPRAIVHNHPPKTITSFISQRRRIYCGHLELKKKSKYEVPTLNSFYVLNVFVKNLFRYNIFITLIAIVLESISRVLGYFDFVVQPSKHYLWERP
jgi:cellulose synthase/poly-beta-1,6-N-acetylglucosamine synthase-like glycosyltransferase